jgi:tungstate transport system substrate-binding protein
VILAATHTIEDSGLLERLIDGFASMHPEYALQVAVSGSGQALELGRNGDIDVLLTHSPEDERDFLEAGHATVRRPVMESDFVLLGPPEDSAKIYRTRDVGQAFSRIAQARAPFISRGDASGTHRKEQSIWEELRITPSGSWYVEAGVGMADALRIASQRGAYVLSDRPTFLILRDALLLDVVSEGDTRLINPYAVLDVSNAANRQGARAFIEWITGPDGQAVIHLYGTDRIGRRLFTTTAIPAPG